VVGPHPFHQTSDKNTVATVIHSPSPLPWKGELFTAIKYDYVVCMLTDKWAAFVFVRRSLIVMAQGHLNLKTLMHQLIQSP